MSCYAYKCKKKKKAPSQLRGKACTSFLWRIFSNGAHEASPPSRFHLDAPNFGWCRDNGALHKWVCGSLHVFRGYMYSRLRPPPCSLITRATNPTSAQCVSQNRTLTASAASARQALTTPGCPACYRTDSFHHSLFRWKLCFCYMLHPHRLQMLLDTQEFTRTHCCTELILSARNVRDPVMLNIYKWSNMVEMQQFEASEKFSPFPAWYNSC